MKRAKPDGRVFVGEIVAEARAAADGQIALLAPKVGLFRDAAAPGTLVGPGSPVGGLEVLGVVHRVLAPTDVAGRVLPHHGVRLARRAVGFRGVLLVLDPHGTEGAAASAAGGRAAAAGSTALQFRSPLSGRFYARPAPDKPMFVKVGDVITRGQTIALVEVMKTFNRLAYGGDELPERVRVVAIHPTDEGDLDEGDAILDLEPA